MVRGEAVDVHERDLCDVVNRPLQGKLTRCLETVDQVLDIGGDQVLHERVVSACERGFVVASRPGRSQA